MSAVLKGAGGGGSKQPRTPVEAPDSLQSIARARILDLLGEGEIEGFATANALESIYLDETPIANPDGSLNFVDVQVDTRLGTQHQDHIAGFPAVENEIAVSQELRPESPFVRQITNLQLSAVNIRVSTPQLSKADTSNGDIKGHSVRYAIDLAVDGGAYVTVLNSAITGKTTTKYERSHRVDLPAATTGWIVRVRRLTAMANSASIADLTFVESLTEVIDGKFRYPNSALAGLGIDAAQFGRIPTRAYNVFGRRVAVPSNYNPITRAYAGVWDGTFKQAWTNNPAWGYYDLVINDRFGLGDRISAGQVDKWTLYKVARYCDGMVPDGRGAMEPRFTAALRLTTRDQALKVLQDVASIFRSMAYWAGGSVMSVADMPEDPVYTYHNGNVIDGRFTYSGSSGRARHTVALVSWSDPADFGRQKIEYVPDDEGIARYGINQTEVIAFGCQSQGQAQRLGKWILLTEKLETDTVTFGAGLDATVAMPGQIIGVADSLRAGRRIGGRVRSATPSQITLDALPAVAVGDALTCTLPDAVTQTRIVSGILGNTLTVTVPFTGTPVPDSAWSIRSTELYEQRFRVLEVKEEEGIRHAITALRHVEGKFDAVELGIEVQLPPITSLPAKVQLPPTGLVIEHRDVAGQNTTATVVTVRWDAVPGAVAYDVEWRQSEGPWTTAGRSYGTTMDIYGVLPGDFEFKVSAVNAVGLQSPPVHEGPYVVPDNAAPPRALWEITQKQIAQQEALDAEAFARLQADIAVAEAAGEDATAKANAARDAAIARVDALAAEIGEIVNAPEWSPTEDYIAGWLVRYNGHLYRAIVANTGAQPDTNPATWQYIGQFASAAEAAAAALELATTTASDLAAEAIRINSLQARMPAGNDVLETKARVDQVNQASVDRDGALAQDISVVSAQAGTAASTATSAMTAAQNAASIANSAQTTAGNAQSTATTALSTAEGAALAVTQVRNQQGTGRNLLADPNFDAGAAGSGWTVGFNPQGANPPAVNSPSSAYSPPGSNALLMYKPGAVTSGQMVGTYVSEFIPVEAGVSLIASGYFSTDRASAVIGIHWYDANKMFLGENYSAAVQGAVTRPDTVLSDFTRAATPVLQPGPAVRFAQVVFRMFALFGSDPVARLVRPQLEVALPGQTQPSNWSASSKGLSTATFALQAAQDAQITLTTNVNGHVSGMTSKNDGQRSVISFLGDVFELITSGTVGVRFTRRNGGFFMRFYAASIQTILGINFGASNNLCFWYGPNVGEENCTQGNGTIWFNNVGSAYFGGSLSAGTLKNAVRSTQVLGTAFVETGQFATNGNQKTITYGLDYLNFGTQNTVPWAGASTRATSGTLTLQRSIGGGSWETLASIPVAGTGQYTNEGGGTYSINVTANASGTYTDNVAGTASRNYRAVLSAPVNWPFTIGSNPGQQTLNLMSIEQ